jgi:hypothetical protein
MAAARPKKLGEPVEGRHGQQAHGRQRAHHPGQLHHRLVELYGVDDGLYDIVLAEDRQQPGKPRLDAGEHACVDVERADGRRAQRRRAAPQLEAQGLGEPHGGVFARRVVGLAGRTDEAGCRSDDHDVPAATLDHGRQKGAGHPEQGQSVDPKGLLDLLVGELEQGAAAHHAGVVHEDVDRPGRFAYPLGDVDHLLAVADVAAVAGGCAGALGGRRGGRLFGAGLV